MFLLDGSAITSASDLSNASYCEFAFLRGIDAKLERIDKLVEPEDEMLMRTSKLGDQHELRVLESYRQEFGSGVVELERPDVRDAEALAAAVAETIAAFRSGVPVVFQAAFFDGSFIGFADFIIRRPDGRYRVQDTKLARSPKVTALLQLAAYVEQLSIAGIPVDDHVDLILGDGAISTHAVSDILPVYRRRRARLLQIVEERLSDDGPVRWGDQRYSVCGRCAHCDAEITASRDVLLVAGLRLTQRDRLLAAGISTIDQLAALTLTGSAAGTAHRRHSGEGVDAVAGTVPGITESTLVALRDQAQLQSETPVEAGVPPFHVHDAAALGLLPQPDPGDIFFDFEGDPLYTEGEPGDARRGDRTRWGIDYLFGLVDTDGEFRAWWAHDFHEERLALIGFLDYLTARRAEFPGMHVYHYAAYERTHLLSLAARHGVGEDVIDDLLREAVLFDLYPFVRKTVRVGSRSYSIKKLEPLYMGDDHRESDVTNAAASITEYAEARELVRSGVPELMEQGRHKLDEIADYNAYDCESTRRLRNWLLALGEERGVLPGTFASDAPEPLIDEPTPLHDALSVLAGDPLDPERSDDATAYALAAAAIDYHRREHKSFWQEHFSRLIAALDEWEDTRNVFTVTSGAVERDWFREGRQRSDRRHVRLFGRWAPGSSVKVGGDPFAVYEYPGPYTLPRAEPGSRPAGQITILEVDDDGSVLIQETLKTDREPYSELPSALTPSPPPRPGTQVEAIAEWGQAIIDAEPEWPRDGVVDILRRRPPRTRSGGPLPHHGDRGTIDDVTAALLDLDDSALAVQGPPGTGKTYVASHVIAVLVQRHGWKIGVVAQSHDVVENLLDRVVKAGLSPALVAKTLRSGADPEADRSYTVLPANGHGSYMAEQTGGFVIGGTAWDFSNPNRFDRRALDLLVIDEAGQFSLAYTIAASVAARNLLLLGDPQQLPQVSQGTHPEPIDTSALGFVADGRDVLPDELGYFLHETWRMDAALTAPVSRLSYGGELRSAAATSKRHLQGYEPGLHVAEVHHVGNATSSPEEAGRVVELVRSTLGLRWTDPDEQRDDALAERDIIVVCPYNAHVATVAEALDEAGFDAVRVGTVDKFQGQEAVVAIVSLAASSPADVPRGMSFLLMKNRLNVGISRAQWAAFLVYSPALTEYLPTTPEGVAELSAFIRLVDGG